MKRRPRQSSVRAFTLIELVLALSMVAIIGVSLYASMRIAFKAADAADLAIEPSRTADLAMSLLAMDLQNAISPNTTITNAVNTTSTTSTTANASDTGYVLAGPFEGTQAQGAGGQEGDDLVFYTTADAPAHPDANGEIKNVELTVEVPQGSQDQCLVRRVTANLVTDQQITPDEEIICRGVSSFALQYFDGSQWNPTWDSTVEDNTMPAAVQVTLTLDRPTKTGAKQTFTYTRVFALSASTAALDPNVNAETSTP